MVQDPITKNDIFKTFLVTSMYGKPGGSWPHETIAACKITWTDEDGKEKVWHQVYRNDDNGHAEKKLIEDLKDVQVIKMQVYINYSPCSECSQTILDYIKEMQLQKWDIKITITFANFYKTHPYNYTQPDKKRKSEETAKKNIKGLQNLQEHPKVELQLLGVHVKWERFLGMSEFFSLSEVDKNDCLDKADSPKRKDRERQDQMVWDDVRPRVDTITSGFEELRLSDSDS